MSHTGNMADSVEMLYDKAKKYALTNAELIALNAVDKTSDMVSSLVAKVLIVLVAAMFALLVSVGLSLLIGNLLEAYYLGFFIVSAFYLVVALVLFIYKDVLIKTPVANMFISKLMKSKNSNLNFLDSINNTDDETA